MNISRNFPAKILIEKIIFWCRRQILTTSYNMSNIHSMVINNISEVVCRETIRFYKNLVLKLRIFNCNSSENSVLKGSAALKWHFLTNNILCTTCKKSFNLFLWQITAMSVITSAEFIVILE